MSLLNAYLRTLSRWPNRKRALWTRLSSQQHTYTLKCEFNPPFCMGPHWRNSLNNVVMIVCIKSLSVKNTMKIQRPCDCNYVLYKETKQGRRQCLKTDNRWVYKLLCEESLRALLIMRPKVSGGGNQRQLGGCVVIILYASIIKNMTVSHVHSIFKIIDMVEIFLQKLKDRISKIKF